MRIKTPVDVSDLTKDKQVALLEDIGRAAFGDTWKSCVADALGVARSSLARWLTGEKPIPLSVWSKIEVLLSDRVQPIQDAIAASSRVRVLLVKSHIESHGAHLIDDPLSAYFDQLANTDFVALRDGYRVELLACQRDHPEDEFIDLTLLGNMIEYQVFVRGGAKPFNKKMFCGLVETYQANLIIAQEFEITSDFLIERAQELLGLKRSPI